MSDTSADTATPSETLQRDGFVVFPGLLRSDEVTRLREQILGRLHRRCVYVNLGKTQPNAAVEVPELGWIFHHPRIIDAARSVIGNPVVFTSHCDIHLNMVSGWHNDCGGNPSYFDCDPFTLTDGCVVKVALYLQDHLERWPGLTVRPGSHLGPSAGDGGDMPLWTAAGDAIVFDVRLRHIGKPHTQRSLSLLQHVLRRFPTRVRGRLGYLAHTAHMRLEGRRDRVSIFFTFGSDNQHTYVFAENNMRRQIKQTGNPASQLTQELRSKLSAQGVRIAGSET